MPFPTSWVFKNNKTLPIINKTGTGKTLLAKTIARLLKVPFTIVDATVLTEAGYVGEDVESILSRLLQVADYDVAAAERGIVFIDEIDKIASASGAHGLLVSHNRATQRFRLEWRTMVCR